MNAFARAGLALLLGLGCGCGSKPPKSPVQPGVQPAIVRPPEAARPLVCPTEVLTDSSDVASLEGQRIAKICVHGAEPKDVDVLRERLAEREGGAFASARAAADIPALFATHLVDDVRITAVPVGSGGIILDVAVKPSPRVAKVIVHGAKVLGDAAVAKSLRMQPGEPLDRKKLQERLHDIEDEYLERGFARAHASFILEPAAGGVTITVNVEEGSAVHVKKVELTGLSQVKAADLRAAMNLHAGDTYVPDQVERNTLLITSALYDRGHLQATVKADPQLAGDEATVTFAVHEGPAFRVGKLRVKGEPLGDEKEVLSALGTKPGSLFSRSTALQDVLVLKARARARGFEVEIVPATELDAKKKVVDLTFDVARAPASSRP